MSPRWLCAWACLAALVAAEPVGAEQAWAASGLPQRRDADGVLHIATAAGDVAVVGRAALDPTVPGRLAALAAQVPGDGHWELRTGLLTGACLRAGDRLVCAQGVLARQEPPPGPAPAALLAAMASAADAVSAALSPELPAVAAESVRALLKRLALPPDADQIPGAYARDLVESRWIEPLAAPGAVAALRAAVAAAEQPRPQEAWEGAGCRLERCADAFGREVWTWRTPETCRYLAPAAGPEFHGHAGLLLAVTLPAGSDPWRDAARASDAILYCGEVPLTRWVPGRPLMDFRTWSEAMRPAGADRLPGWPAPHLLLTAADGTPLRLCVADRRHPERIVEVVAPADDGADAEDFLARAAAALDDPAALALIGDCFFQYAHDSPDPAHPLLIGEPERCGDIHQTARQSLATTLRGRFRGDCDDLAEVYTDLLTRQGRLAHVMSLPSHAAAGFLLPEDGGWTFRILQSGPALAWHADEPSAAVVAAYDAMRRRIGGHTDVNQVGVLLRFADENTRSGWILSWRIYRDPDYARTMIAVERDWHYRTYHHGLDTMRALIDGGDHDSANYSEMAGLYRRIGDWRAAATWRKRALEATAGSPSPEQRVQELYMLERAGRDAELEAEIAALERDELAPMARREPLRAVELAVQVASWLDPGRHAEVRRGLIERRIRPWFAGFTPTIRGWVAKSFKPEIWSDDRGARLYRAAGGLVVGELLQPWRPDGLRPAGERERPLADWWYGEILALPQERRSSPLYTATWPGWWLACRLPPRALDRLVTAAPEPAPWDGQAVGWSDALADGRIASWLGRSQIWLGERLGQAAAPPDSPRRDAAVRQWLERIAAAERFLADRGLADPMQARAAANARLIAALVLRDDALLASCLRDLARRGDRVETESAAGLVGAWAGAMPSGRLATVLAQWHAVVAQKPYALEIAWSALLAGQWDAALDAAGAAVARYLDDPILVEEARDIAALVAERRAAAMP